MTLIHTLQEVVSDEWEKFFEGIKPKHINSLIVRRTQYRTNVILFGGKTSAPFAFAKVTSCQDEARAFQNEFAMLKFVSGKLDASLRDSVPVPLLLLEENGESALLQKALVGKPLLHRLNGAHSLAGTARFRSAMGLAYEWWQNYVESFSNADLVSAAYLQAVLEDIGRRYESTFPDDERNHREFEILRKKVGASDFSHMRAIPVHGDYWAGNLSLGKDRLHVLDWERARKSGLPIFDIFLFASTVLDDSGNGDGIGWWFGQNDARCKSVTAVARRALSFLNIKRGMAIALFEMFLFDMSAQGLLHFGRKIRHDDTWKQRLDRFIENKSRIVLEDILDKDNGQ